MITKQNRGDNTRRAMKKPLKILIGIFAVILVLLFAKNLIAKVTIERGVEFATGLKLR